MLKPCIPQTPFLVFYPYIEQKAKTTEMEGFTGVIKAVPYRSAMWPKPSFS
jgi:hypothetical protein